MAAAWSVLERSGFRSLKVRQVLAPAGVSANGFYRRFPSRSHLMIALMEDEAAAVSGRLTARLRQEAEPPRQLYAWVDELVDVAFHPVRLQRARIFLDPVLAEEQPVATDRLGGATTVALADVLRRGRASGHFGAVDEVLTARAVHLLLRGFTFERLAGTLAASRDDTVETVLAMLSDALGVEPPLGPTRTGGAARPVAPAGALPTLSDDTAALAADRAAGTTAPDPETERIVAAAWRVLERSHFRTLKVRQVLAASEVSASLFYRRYPSKGALLVAMIDDENRRAAAHMQARLRPERDVTGRLRAWVEGGLQIVYDDRLARRSRLFLDPVLAAEHPREFERLVAVTIDPGRDLLVAAGMSPQAAGLRARATYHAVRGFLGDRLSGTHDWARADVARTLTALLLPRRPTAPGDG